MKSVAQVAALAVATYSISWTVAYLVLVGSNFDYFTEYLRLAWTSPGEIPAMLQFVSLAVVVAVVAGFLVIRAVLRKRTQSPVPTKSKSGA